MIKKLFFALLYCASFLMQAQEPVSIHLTENDGLPDVEFYNGFEDSKGFIWLAADKGLYRYDGIEFLKFSNQEQRGLSVFEPKEDHLGRVWCNNISGQFFYVENEQLKTFVDLRAELKGELAEFIITQNHLLVFIRKQIFVIDLETKQIVKRHKAKEQFGSPFKINNTIIFGSGNELLELSESNELVPIITFKQDITTKKSEKTFYNKSVCFSLNGNLFFKESDGINIFQIDVEAKKASLVKGLEILSEEKRLKFFQDDNKLWVASNSGVYIFDFENNQFVLEKRILKNVFVTKILKDKDANFWLTTLTDGVFVIPNIYIEQPQIAAANSNISCMDKVNDSTVVFGVNTGDLGIFNIASNTIKQVDLPSLAKVSNVHHDAVNNNYLIGKDDVGYVLNKNLDFVSNVFDVYNAKGFSNVNTDILYANYNNVFLLDGKQLYAKKRVISKNRRAYTTFHDSISKLSYVSFVDGLVAYDAYWNPKTIKYKGTPIYVKSIAKTKNKNLYAASFKDGIYVLEENNIIDQITVENGLISNEVSHIEADEDLLWIATDKGIQRYNTSTKTFNLLTKRDGIISYAITGIETLGNTVVFASNKGLFTLQKDKAFKNQRLPKVYFKSISINEEPQQMRNEFELDYDQNAIEFNFNVNGFQYNQKENYNYRLLGYNDNWSTTALGTNSVKYSSLPAGNFKFQVKPVAGFKDAEIAEVTISIALPLWKRWWFILLCALGMGTLVALYYKAKLKQKEKERQQQVNQLFKDNELIALKLENLRSQMNPHFIFNALNSIQEYIILNQKHLASDYLGKFADLIRKYLNHSHIGEITLNEELESLEMYLELEKLRFEDKLNYTITVNSECNTETISIPTMLIQPYVENALKHGLLHRKHNRTLRIDFNISAQEKLLKCNITDNGIGRAKAETLKARSYKNHKSFATKATQDRLNLLNYGKAKKIGVTITDLFEKKLASGTKVSITIPYKTMSL